MNYALNAIENALSSALWAVDDDPPVFKCLFMGHEHAVNLRISRTDPSTETAHLLIELQGYTTPLLTNKETPSWTHSEEVIMHNYMNTFHNPNDIRRCAFGLYIKFRGIWQDHCSKHDEKDKEETK